MNIGQKVRSLREENKVTQEELGKFLGVKRSSVANYESGKRSIDLTTCEKIANYFDVTVDYLLSSEKEFSKDFVYNAKAYFLSDEITEQEKDEVIKEVMDFYFNSKAGKGNDQTKGESDSKRVQKQ